jgi:hypothetical protein
MSTMECSLPGCDSVLAAKGLCATHHRAARPVLEYIGQDAPVVDLFCPGCGRTGRRTAQSAASSTRTRLEFCPLCE